VLGGVASVAGVRVTFAAVGVFSLALVAWAAVTPAEPPAEPQPLGALWQALRDVRVTTAAWFVLLPALLLGSLAVLAPLRLSALGYGSVAIGAVFLVSGACEALANLVLGRLSDRVGTVPLIAWGLAASTVAALLLPIPDRAFVLGVLVVVGTTAFGIC